MLSKEIVIFLRGEADLPQDFTEQGFGELTAGMKWQGGCTAIGMAVEKHGFPFAVHG